MLSVTGKASAVTLISFLVVMSVGKATVIVCDPPTVTISFAVPATVNVCVGRSTTPVPVSPAICKSSVPVFATHDNPEPVDDNTCPAVPYELDAA